MDLRAASREYDVTFYYVFDWHRDASWNFTDHRIPVPTFWYILEGSRILHAAGARVRLEPGMLVALPAHTMVSTEVAGDEETPIHYLALGVQAIVGGMDWIERYGIPIAMHVVNNRELRDFIRLWGQLRDDIAYIHSLPPADMENGESRLSAQHTSLALSWEGKLKLWLSLLTLITLPHMSIPKPVVDQRVTAICTYIRRNYAGPIDAGELAKFVSLSPGHMRAIFRDTMGMSPHQYILQIRINKAKELLAASRLSLMDISEMTGFEDVSYFIQMFKRKEGLTPASYRKRACAWNV